MARGLGGTHGPHVASVLVWWRGSAHCTAGTGGRGHRAQHVHACRMPLWHGKSVWWGSILCSMSSYETLGAHEVHWGWGSHGAVGTFVLQTGGLTWHSVQPVQQGAQEYVAHKVCGWGSCHPQPLRSWTTLNYTNAHSSCFTARSSCHCRGNFVQGELCILLS